MLETIELSMRYREIIAIDGIPAFKFERVLNEAVGSRREPSPGRFNGHVIISTRVSTTVNDANFDSTQTERNVGRVRDSRHSSPASFQVRTLELSPVMTHASTIHNKVDLAASPGAALRDYRNELA